MIKVKLDRFKGVEEKTYKVEILTPMFLGGANPKNAELRAASIKGALRFWWRALHPDNNIQRLLERESKIFGSADENTGGKSRVYIKLSNINLRTDNKIWDLNVQVCSHNRNIPIVKYMTMGLWNFSGDFNTFKRRYINEGSHFNLKLRFPKNKGVEEALNYLIYFGGLGSKCRNGFGSLHINENNTPQRVQSNFQWQDLRYFAFSNDTRAYKSRTTFTTWRDAFRHGAKTYFALKKSLKPDEGCEKRGLVARPLIPCNVKGRYAKWMFFDIVRENNGFKSVVIFMPHRLGLRDFDNSLYADILHHFYSNITNTNGVHFERFGGCQAGNLGGNYERIW